MVKSAAMSLPVVLGSSSAGRKEILTKMGYWTVMRDGRL